VSGPRKPIVPDRRTAIVLGLGAYLLGSLLLWDAYENRGRSRPFATRFLPGA
jgi:hypothetical protein